MAMKILMPLFLPIVEAQDAKIISTMPWISWKNMAINYQRSHGQNRKRLDDFLEN
jgi:hypothetical protein